MTIQFNRDFKLTIGNRIFQTTSKEGQPQQILGVSFSVEKDLKKEPNKARLNITNLSEASRKNDLTKGSEIQIEAGHLGNLQIIFKGDLTESRSTKGPADWRTVIEAGDGAKALRTGRVNFSFKKGAKPKEIFDELGKQIGLPLGNVTDVISDPSALKNIVNWVKGKVLSGNAGDIMEELSNNLGYDMSSQDGAISFLKRGTKQVLKENPIVLSPTTGMLASPEVGKDGELKIMALLNGGLKPGRQIDVTSKVVSGSYRITRIVHTGDTWGDSWNTEMEAEPL